MKTGHRDRAQDGPGARAAATLYGRGRVACICLFTVGDRWERSRDVFLGVLLLLAGEPVYVAVVTKRAPLDQGLVSSPRPRIQFVSSVGHMLSAGSSSDSPTPCGPFSKMCISAGTFAFRNAR
jgi:hypothetical protein